MGEHLGWRRATCQANGGEVRLLLVAASAAGSRGRKSFHGNGTLEQQRREWLIVAIPWEKKKQSLPGHRVACVSSPLDTVRNVLDRRECLSHARIAHCFANGPRGWFFQGDS